jgi:hypothetical protein
MKRISIIFLLTICVNFLFANLLYDITDGKYIPRNVNMPRSCLLYTTDAADE